MSTEEYEGLADPQYLKEGSHQLKLSKKDISLGHKDETCQSHLSALLFLCVNCLLCIIALWHQRAELQSRMLSSGGMAVVPFSKHGIGLKEVAKGSSQLLFGFLCEVVLAGNLIHCIPGLLLLVNWNMRTLKTNSKSFVKIHFP